jgi:hypothetical protein
LGHAGEPKVTALRQERGIEDRQRVVPARFATIEMLQVLTETRPLVNFDEQVGQINQGQARRDALLKPEDALGVLLRGQRGDDDMPLVYAHLAMTGDQPIDAREQLGQLASALFQTQSPVFGHVELLADLCTPRGPPVFGNQVGVGIGIAPAARDPDITRTKGAP